MTGDSLSVLIDTMRDVRVLNLILVGSIFFLAYDTVLMFPSEVRLIWQRKWSAGKVLYLVCRYPVLVLQIVSLILSVKTDCSLTLVKGLLVFKYWMATICATPVQILMAIRTYAPYGGSIPVKRFVIALFVAEQLLNIAMNVVLTVKTEYKKIPLTGASCFLEASNAPKGAGVVLFAAAAAYEILLTSMAFARLYRAVREGDSRIAWVIIKNGLAYFTIVTLFCVTEFFIFVSLPYSRLLVPIGTAYLLQGVGSVLSCRLMLQLRTCLAEEDDTGGELFSMSARPTQLEDVVFAAEGNQSWGSSTQSRSVSDDSEPTKEDAYEIPTKRRKVDVSV